MTALAYVLTFSPISALVVMCLVVTLGVALGLLIFPLPMLWVPEKQRIMVTGVRGIVVGFLCGVLGEGAGFGVGYLIFHWLVGPGSFTLLPICIAAIPLLLPPILTLAKARRVEAVLAGVSEHTIPTVLLESTWGAAVGQVVGLVGGLLVCVAVSMS
ncbi:MAG: hypothetical protein JW753_01740 [Dehalococcoidia bacterium]|nr:hypothetical protein [Dehalococcoidia bacterium]